MTGHQNIVLTSYHCNIIRVHHYHVTLSCYSFFFDGLILLCIIITVHLTITIIIIVVVVVVVVVAAVAVVVVGTCCNLL